MSCTNIYTGNRNNAKQASYKGRFTQNKDKY